MAGNSYILRFKEDASDDEVSKTKKELTDSGAEITHEYSLIKAVSVNLPETEVGTFEAHEHVAGIEKDQEVKALDK
ncbi:peptidase inhibitor I9 [Myxozyma melibiosi]|uniref:Peptidase inhibitor I9 n=1 Tax=Myxozyma melibiosi TaxID=54550 RepID=A0ABR1F0P3_9ASCO